ncbi:BtrH N-terminal domain-containing protein [Micromonospora sp. RP3T]|uniref:BtrH N-terminal domain-containing protein n=1 Tax=Micromonospora sp. RP3T TaxID=2135446 RepID=UPI003D76597C
MRVTLDGYEPWWFELGNCLHSSVAAVLRARGVAPLPVLGAHWGFRYRLGDARREEYYLPLPRCRSLVGALLPYHPVRSTWHEPDDEQQAWEQIREQIRGGGAAVVAVDNFHLPFRPAYHDVHSNHLVVVHGFDDSTNQALVLDAVPPVFHDWLDLKHLDAARGSTNVGVHQRDMFFADVPVGRRWFDIAVDGPVRDDPARDVPESLRRNVAGFLADDPFGEQVGIAGLSAFLADSADRHEAGVAGVVDELFTVAGPHLASTALHAAYLRRAGRAREEPRWRELARRVDRVAHHWSALRITAAAARGEPGQAPLLRRRARALVSDLTIAVEECADVARAQ